MKFGRFKLLSLCPRQASNLQLQEIPGPVLLSLSPSSSEAILISSERRASIGAKTGTSDRAHEQIAMAAPEK